MSGEYLKGFVSLVLFLLGGREPPVTTAFPYDSVSYLKILTRPLHLRSFVLGFCHLQLK